MTLFLTKLTRYGRKRIHASVADGPNGKVRPVCGGGHQGRSVQWQQDIGPCDCAACAKIKTALEQKSQLATPPQLIMKSKDSLGLLGTLALILFGVVFFTGVACYRAWRFITGPAAPRPQAGTDAHYARAMKGAFTPVERTIVLESGTATLRNLDNLPASTSIGNVTRISMQRRLRR